MASAGGNDVCGDGRSAVYRQNAEHVAAEEFDGEFVLIQFARGTYFSLRGTAVDVWRQFEAGASAAEVAQRVARRFGREDETALASLAECIDRLVAEDLLCECETSCEAPGAWASEVFAEPVVEVYSDLQELIVLDPIHEVDDAQGWPWRRAPDEDA
jgi:hypothetical protein